MNKKKRGPVKLLWKLTPLVIKAAPGAFLLTTVMAVFHGVSWGAVTAGQQIFFDGVTEFATGKASLKRVLAAFSCWESLMCSATYLTAPATILWK